MTGHMDGEAKRYTTEDVKWLEESCTRARPDVAEIEVSRLAVTVTALDSAEAVLVEARAEVLRLEDACYAEGCEREQAVRERDEARVSALRWEQVLTQYWDQTRSEPGAPEQVLAAIDALTRERDGVRLEAAAQKGARGKAEANERRLNEKLAGTAEETRGARDLLVRSERHISGLLERTRDECTVRADLLVLRDDVRKALR